MSDALQIVELRAENVKRLKVVHIKPDADGSMVVISGDNGHGKSSILDAIAMVFGGKEQIPGTPVRVGKELATIVADLGDIIVTRKISAEGHTSLKVQSRDGASFTSPQRMLDELTGKLTFDPLSFSRMKPKDQAELLRELLGLDFLDLMRERLVHYEERTEVNRTIKQAEVTVQSMPEPPDDLPERVSVSALLIELNAAEAANRDAQAYREKITNAERTKASIEKERAALRLELESLNSQHDEAEKMLAHLLENPRLDADVGPIAAQISGAEGINAQHHQVEERKRAVVRLGNKRDEASKLTDKIKAIDKARLAEIAKAEMPVPGLGFNDDGLVTLNELTLEQASEAEKLRVSVAIGIAMNPKLRVLLVRDASLLDDKSMAMVALMAKEGNCQLWVERIEVDERTTVIIEDGAIKT